MLLMLLRLRKRCWLLCWRCPWFEAPDSAFWGRMLSRMKSVTTIVSRDSEMFVKDGGLIVTKHSFCLFCTLSLSPASEIPLVMNRRSCSPAPPCPGFFRLCSYTTRLLRPVPKYQLLVLSHTIPGQDLRILVGCEWRRDDRFRSMGSNDT